MRTFLFLLVAVPFALASFGCDDDDGGGGTCTPTAEVCGDGIDNDCDGVIDNGCNTECSPGETQDCGSDVGACEFGTQSCGTDGTWGECLGGVEPTAEECDGIDNNCNGDVDESLTQACDTACGAGVEVCLNGEWANCNAQQPETEVCDGVDNDCDGEIDNGAGMECARGTTQNCGSDVGECAIGTEICDDTCNWSGNCLGATIPADEACDGLDNDCDGVVDNGCTCTAGDTQACGTNEGECAQGTQTCGSNGEWGATCDGEVSAAAETCDELDNDCDGIVDNGITSMMEGANVDDTCSQARQDFDMTERQASATNTISGYIYKGDLTADVDIVKFNVWEASDLTCIAHPGYSECHEYQFDVYDDAGLPLEFDVVFTNISYDDPADRVTFCEDETYNNTWSGMGGSANVKIVGDCLMNSDWEVYLKIYTNTATYSCSEYQIDVTVVDAVPQDTACDSTYYDMGY